MEQFRLGYCLGILISTAAFSGDGVTPTVSMNVHPDSLEFLDQMLVAFGGKIYGPYTHSKRRYCKWVLRGRELVKLVRALQRHLPRGNKHNEFQAWVRRYDIST